MEVIVSSEQRFQRTPDGSIWTPCMHEYEYWCRYLEVFNRVRVVARVKALDGMPENRKLAGGSGVSFSPLPCYLGPREFLLKYHLVQKGARKALESKEAVILKLPSTISGRLAAELRRSRHPYGVEVVGDPYDVFAPGAVQHPLRMLFRWWFTRETRKLIRRACASTFVTRSALQHRYPPDPGTFTTYYSSIVLADIAFSKGPRTVSPDKRRFRLVTVGSLAQLYKAPDVLIDAVAACLKEGLDLELEFVGDGKERYGLEKQTLNNGLRQRVRFIGEIPAGGPVRDELDKADLFVLPSRTEGLPRAMIEAMARGLPCIGTTVGGIPEILPSEDMVPPGDSDALARKIMEVILSPKRMEHMSARNFSMAREYHEDVLRPRRVAFYKYLEQKTRHELERF